MYSEYPCYLHSKKAKKKRTTSSSRAPEETPNALSKKRTISEVIVLSDKDGYI